MLRRALPVLRGTARYLLAIVFLAAGASKLLDLSQFVDRLVVHSPLRAEIARAAALFLPWLELTCGVCLAVGYAVREAATIVAVLLLMFLGYSLFFRIEGDCGCFIIPQWTAAHWWWTPLRNLLLLPCAVLVMLNSGSARKNPDADASRLA
jgi:uncharacterized membrane protein YphA (DoxX/SURF4 family)